MNIKNKYYWVRGEIKNRFPTLAWTITQALIYAVVLKAVFTYF